MPMKKSSFVILFMLLQLVACAQKKSCAVVLIEATSRNWVAGAGGRTGTAYRFKLKTKTNTHIEFSGLWIGKKSVPITLEYDALTPPIKSKKGDVVYVTTNVINNVEEIDYSPKKLPFSYKGVALLQLTISDKVQYLFVKSFRFLERLSGE